MPDTKNESEWIELSAHRALFDSVPAAVRNDLGFQLQDINGIVCSLSSAEPSILINRCFVTEQEALKDISTIHSVKALYEEAGVKEFFMHVPYQSREITSKLEEAGMTKSRGWMKFRRDSSPAIARNPDLDIREINSEHATDFASIVCPCFDLTDISIPMVASVVAHPDYHIYLGFEDDTPVATGGFFHKDGVAHCDWGSTHRDYRGKGFQGALLARRINDAIEMGAKTIYTATGEEVPGDPQHSYKNILRYGFEEYYLRENWVPA